MKHAARKCSWKKRIIRFLIYLATACALLELILRAIGLHHTVLYEEDPAVGYRLKPSQQIHSPCMDVQINQWGVRDPRPLDHKLDGTSRIIILGDSVTWGGVRIRQADLFTTLLENAFPDTEVINAGVNGYSVGQMVALYTAHLKGLEPDGILVFTIPRDYERPPVSRLNGSSVAFPLCPPFSAVAVAVATSTHVVRTRLGWAWLAPAPFTLTDHGISPGPDQIEPNITLLAALARAQHNSPSLRVVLFPQREALPDLEKQIAESLDRSGVPWLDYRSLCGTPPVSWYMADGVHLTREGHAGLAQALVTLAQTRPDKWFPSMAQ